MRREKSVPVGELFSQLLKNSGLEEGVKRVDVFNAYNQVVGNRYAEYTSSKYFKDGRLTCVISSYVARNSLIMHRMTIIERMNGLLGNNLVKELILK